MKNGPYSAFGFSRQGRCEKLLFLWVFTGMVWAHTSNVVLGQSPCTVSAGPDMTGCSQGSVQLSATPGFDAYVWSPATGLNNPHIANPTALVGGTVTYTVMAISHSGPAVNVLTNGDFSQGDVGFTSGYISQNMYSPCYYTVGSDYYSTNLGWTDHSTGADNMFMSVDCCDQPTVLWQQTVAILPNADYQFSFWTTRAAVTQATFEVFFVGDVTGEISMGQLTGIAYAGADAWDEYAVALWNSGSNTSVIIRVVTLAQTIMGSDFAVDDFAFVTTACGSSDAVQVSEGQVPPPVMPEPFSACQNEVFPPLQAEGAGILWYDSPAGVSSATAPVPNTASVGIVLYYASQTVGGCESGLVATWVTVIGAPVFDLAESFSACVGDVQKLGVEEIEGWQYLWMDGRQGPLREVSSADVGTTVYTLTVNNGCQNSVDSVAVVWEECLCLMYWPNAFSPNADVYNPTFKPVYDCRIEEFDLRIFNRWGELIFESRNPDEGWGGQRNGQPAEQGMYVVQVNYSALSGAKKIHKSATDKLTLLR